MTSEFDTKEFLALSPRVQNQLRADGEYRRLSNALSKEERENAGSYWDAHCSPYPYTDQSGTEEFSLLSHKVQECFRAVGRANLLRELLSKEEGEELSAYAHRRDYPNQYDENGEEKQP